MKKHQTSSPCILASFLVGTCCFLSIGYASGEAELKNPVLPETALEQHHGRADYSWQLRALNGKAQTFSVFERRVVFLHFWATWCPHCARQMSSIQKLHEKFKDNEDMKFVLATHQNEEVVKKYLTKVQLQLPIYLYSEKAPKVFGPHNRIPRTFIVDGTGEIVLQHIGAANWNDESVVNLLQDLF